MNWSFFSDIYVLNQTERPDRWMKCKQELARVGIENYNQFLSIPDPLPMKSFCISQYELIKTFVREGGSTLLGLEDDVLFTDLNTLQEAILQLPAEWDVLYLGCNLRGQRPEPYTNNLRRIKTAWTSHAIAYSRKAAQYIIDNYNPELGQMYDDWLSGQLDHLNAFVLAPMIAYQRPGKSDLWGCETDYTSTINEGNLLL